MTTSTLTQLLHFLQEADEPLSLNEIARKLAVSPARLAGMLDYWGRRGRIGETIVGGNCGPCGARGSCRWVTGQPRRYELVGPDEVGQDRGGMFCCPAAPPDPAESDAPDTVEKHPALNQ